MSMSAPVVALTFLGVLISVLGLFGGGIEWAVVGLVALGVAGILQIAGQRRS